MKEETFCQSCSMPIDNPLLRGTEKDGSPSNEYCKFCYQNGEFTNPNLSMAEMKDRMMEKMDNRNLPEHSIQEALKRFKHLKRWTAEESY